MVCYKQGALPWLAAPLLVVLSLHPPAAPPYMCQPEMLPHAMLIMLVGSDRLIPLAFSTCCLLQEGYVVQRPAARASMEDVRAHLLSCAVDESGRYPPFVAIMRGADGLPKLLTRAALDALCERLGAGAEEGGSSVAAEGTPCVLQVRVDFLECRAFGCVDTWTLWDGEEQ